MASGQLLAKGQVMEVTASRKSTAEDQTIINVPVSSFEFENGMWKPPTKEGDPESLDYGNNIQATATINPSILNEKTAKIIFTIGKPMESYGWDKSNLCFKAECGSKSYDGYLADAYRGMPRGKVSVFGMPLDMSDNNNPLTKKLHLTLHDSDTSLKGGLDFYGATVEQPLN